MPIKNTAAFLNSDLGNLATSISFIIFLLAEVKLAHPQSLNKREVYFIQTNC